ncbi:hypothetical protein APHCRT_1514 [Anaplasma phagocytophilum str. CRT53-1]|uniref:Uncharacterized protein n=1 Tax=Anaplasma phagocytophilum str. CRT53-1 TaxID=1359157 RepID=A0A0F3PK53_ANAPH|nr:hypothetical protein APHCRT_1514 [Anaplasma phagocytophilum str. CRT53-1]
MLRLLSFGLLLVMKFFVSVCGLCIMRISDVQQCGNVANGLS